MRTQFTLDFEGRNGQDATIRFTQEREEEDREGTWTAPFPNTGSDSYAFGLIEMWYQTDDHIVAGTSYNYGDPIRLTSQFID